MQLFMSEPDILLLYLKITSPIILIIITSNLSFISLSNNFSLNNISSVILILT